MKGKMLMNEEFKLIEGDIVPIYENNKGERLVNARELHGELGNKRKFADWIKQRIEQYDFAENQEFIRFHNFVKGGEKGYGNKSTIEYYLTVDMAKELCMIENNEKGKLLRKYFIEVEKRYRKIVESPQNIFDIMHIALNQIEENEKRLKCVEIISKENREEIKDIKSKIDVIIQKDYCLASDIAEQLEIYSENDLPHSNLIGAIARILGMKISYKHYYEDERIAIVPDI
jgi:phage anti-repressor protein